MTTRTWILSSGAVCAGWISLQLGVMYFTNAAPGALALYPTAGFISDVPADAAIADIGDHWISVVSAEPDLAKRLYASGAWMVLPAGLSRCLTLH